ncbi:hypothetical protein NDU88_007132 [Pleurodeles waltl]|uniref:Uncharacterized protein n=1 Tax=Pleurodeles waltl TaxID=8319 RepID=A0AAV7UPL4_PLEWA|nr:hypothetical protein NDU88_007132 [Pleurodeles waltl]
MCRRVGRVGCRSGERLQALEWARCKYARRSLGSSSSAVTSVALSTAPNGEALGVEPSQFLRNPQEQKLGARDACHQVRRLNGGRCDGPARYGLFTNPTCAGTTTIAPVLLEEAANPDSLPAVKAGPGICGAGPGRPEKLADERREARNGGVVSSCTGGQNGDHRQKPEGEEESDGGTDISASWEA